MRLSLQALARQLNIVGLANGNGGRHLGCEAAVSVLQKSDIFNSCKVPHRWHSVIEETVSGRHRQALNGIVANSRNLAKATSHVLANQNELLVIGGDHSSAIGTWSGVASYLRHHGDIGLIWVDAHMDSHTVESSPSGNFHGMPLAHLLGYGNNTLTNVGDEKPKIKPENLAMVGIRSYEEPERKLLESLGVRIFYDEEVAERGIETCMEEAIAIVSRNTYGYGMSIDIDGFRVEDAPAVGTPAEGGIIADEFLNFVRNHPLSDLVAVELVEFLPRFDCDKKSSERLMLDLVEAIFLKRFQEKRPSRTARQ
uniref:Arginase n=1 Tax=Steinernema glaseri TaxID=37863 RepID=A0A1I8AUE5_9BILA